MIDCCPAILQNEKTVFTTNFSKTALTNLLKYFWGTFFIMILVKIEKVGQKNEQHFLIGVAMDFKFHGINVYLLYISYSNHYQL